jgi:hypothetical protein
MHILLSNADRHDLALYIFIAIAAVAGIWTLLKMILRFIFRSKDKNDNPEN